MCFLNLGLIYSSLIILSCCSLFSSRGRGWVQGSPQTPPPPPPSASTTAMAIRTGSSSQTSTSSWSWARAASARSCTLANIIYVDELEPVAGKTKVNHSEAHLFPPVGSPAGDAGREEGHGWAVRHQNPEEGCRDPGRRCGVHHGGKESPRSVWETTFPHSAALLFPNHGSARHLASKRGSSPPKMKNTLFSSYLNGVMLLVFNAPHLP